MAPTYQDVGTFQSGAAVQLTVPWPAHAVDDIAFLFVQSNSDVGLLTANGFVQVADSPQSGTGSVMSVWWCRATSTSMASPVTNTGNNNISAVIVTVRGAITSGNPWEVTSGAATAVITTVSITGDTTTIADQLIIYADGRGSDVAGAVFSGEADTNVTGLVERFDNGTASGNGGGIGVWTATKATAGAYGPLTCTALGVASGQAHWTASIKPAAGTGHTANPTDAEGLLDSVAQVAGYAPAQTDPEGLLDSAGQVTDSVRDTTDPLGLLDDVSYQLTSDSAQTFTDPLGLTDSVAQVADQVRDATDPLGLLDSATSAQDHTRDISDALGLVDNGEWIAIGADAVGILDTVTAIQGHNRDLTDPLGQVDSVSYDLVNAQAVTDPLGLVDSVSQIADSTRDPTDPVGLLDSVTTTGTYLPAVTDVVGLTDSVSYDLTAGGVAYTATITDSLGLTDDASSSLGITIQIDDGLGLTDTASTAASYFPIITDILGLLDSQSRIAVTDRQLTDLLGLVDEIDVIGGTIFNFRWGTGRPLSRNATGTPRGRWAVARPRQ